MAPSSSAITRFFKDRFGDQHPTVSYAAKIPYDAIVTHDALCNLSLALAIRTSDPTLQAVMDTQDVSRATDVYIIVPDDEQRPVSEANQEPPKKVYVAMDVADHRRRSVEGERLQAGPKRIGMLGVEVVHAGLLPLRARPRPGAR